MKLQFFKKIAIHFCLMAALGFSLLYIFFYGLLPHITHQGKLVEVPDLRGLAVEELDTYLLRYHLQYVITDYTNYSSDLPPFSVLQQFPLQGSWVKKHRKIYLTLNAEYPSSVSMPNLVEGSIRQAKLLLSNQGLKLGHVEYVPDLAKYAVLEQWHEGKPIPPGKLVMQGAKIDLVVGKGLGEEQIAMPNVLNMALEEAELVLLEHGIRTKVIHYVQVDTSDKGMVCKQKPTENTKLPTGAFVNLWITK